MNHTKPNKFLLLPDYQLDAGGYEKWETQTIYCLPGCETHFYSPDGIGRVFTYEDYSLEEMIGDQGDRFVGIQQI